MFRNYSTSSSSRMDYAFTHEMIYLTNDKKSSKQTIILMYCDLRLKRSEPPNCFVFCICLQTIHNSMPCSTFWTFFLTSNPDIYTITVNASLRKSSQPHHRLILESINTHNNKVSYCITMLPIGMNFHICFP